MSNFNGLLVCNVELTSYCNKNPGCWMCGRRQLEKEHPSLCNWGDMDLDMAINIIKQLPEGIVIQYHNNGEPLLYPYLEIILGHSFDKIKCMDTNGILLLEKADEIIGSLDTLTISVIENDPIGDEQYEIVKKFLKLKGTKKPFMIYRLLGDVGKIDTLTSHKELKKYCSFVKIADLELQKRERRDRWYKLPGIVATRVLHDPKGSFDYQKEVTVPEHGICIDLLCHLVVDRFGDVYPCVRFNPYKYNLLGNIKKTSLLDLWNSKKRLNLIKEHIRGNRSCSELCEKCQYYGCPTGN